MGFFLGLVFYIRLWWWVVLMSLSFGGRPVDVPESGHATSAPAKPMRWRKMAASTAIAAVLFIVVYLIIDSGVISFRPE